MKTIENSIFYKKYLSAYFLVDLGFILNDEIIKSYVDFLKSFVDSTDVEQNLNTYSSFIQNLSGKNLVEHLKTLILKENITNFQNIEKEFNILKELFSIGYNEILEEFQNKFPDIKDIFLNLAEFETGELDLNLDELKKLNETKGDIFNQNQAFIFDENFELKPVKVADNITFKDLKGYKSQQKILIENTKALLQNKHVNNILLYGDAGCGKSSSVRALMNEFKEIKIIQIFKDNLINLDKLYQKLYDIPHKFIIFADDISFSDTDGTFSTMKAILEGSIITCPNNAVIYATSNRRHLVKETFQSRLGDEIHLNDTMNEVSSLSERFGINLLFARPNNDEFNNIILELAKDNNIDSDEHALIEKGQKLALIKGSRSPRIAKQLIDNILAGIDF